jgi:hypothetical protein
MMTKSFLLTICAWASFIVASVACTTPTVPLAYADAPSADPILSQYPDWALRLLCESNAYSNQNPLRGRTLRFQTPVAINLNRVPQALEATRNIEAMTSGAVTFKIVDSDPSFGIVVVAGDALNRDGVPGLGHVSSSREPQSGFALKTQSHGAIQSRLYVHLGSAQRDYVREGFRPASIAEHEIAHALGLIEHFPGFTGIEGVSLEMLVALTALYRVPPGTDMSQFCKSK